MPGFATSSSRAHLERGGFTWVSALLLLAVLSGGYLAWTWAPVWFLHLEVKSAVRDYMNQAVRNTDDEQLVANMVHKFAVLDRQLQPDENGQLVESPTVQVDPRDVAWTRDADGTPPTVHVKFTYTRVVRFPLINRFKVTTMAVDLTGDLSLPDWGPQR
jgi:hypothetical protein